MSNGTFAVKVVTVVLGIVAVLGVSGLLLLGYAEKPIPVELVGVTTGAIGALSSLLASTRPAPPVEQPQGGLR